MAPTTATNPRLETYVSNMCSERLHGPQGNTDENPILAQLKEQEFYDAMPNRQSDSLAKRRSTRYASTGVASEQLPTYQETSNAEAYKDCGCVEETNKLRTFVNWTMGNPRYLLCVFTSLEPSRLTKFLLCNLSINKEQENTRSPYTQSTTCASRPEYGEQTSPKNEQKSQMGQTRGQEGPKGGRKGEETRL